MATVNFLSELWGFFLIVVCFALLIKPKHVQNVFALVENETALLVTGMVSVFLGFFTVLSYNTWNQSWATIVTVVGWLIIVKGILCLFMPEWVMKMMTKFKTQYMNMLPIVLVIGVLLGCVLVYLGLTM